MTILCSAVQFYVMGYYNKIRDQFSSMEGNSFSFDDLATTIKLAYIKFKREGLSQSEVFNHLAH
ncbi:MAG: ABC-three component system protein [Limosilactobacillus pontis]